ncbi:MAG: hypothetical protein WCJ92_07950 [Alphaproteobacteria bacterium]
MENTISYRASYGSNIYRTGNKYRVRVSVNGSRRDQYVNTLKEARSLKSSWLKLQAA